MADGDDKLLTLADYRRAALSALSATAWRYFRSGADAEATLRENVRAYSRWQIWPRVLVDVAERDLSTTLLGAAASMPVMIAPTAYHKLAHPDGELATARAAAAAGVVMCAATLATTSLEAIAATTPAPKWFQLYVHRDEGLTAAMVERAAEAGYRALVITVDTAVLGRRLGDERYGFSLPPSLS
ncbi:MAG TPA: alpha-hydroxy acid oxidase, partial [Polyangia bacterium]|nr:alpha-hydroxy acid oxidase [Polyangia bacterium]